MKNSSLNPNKLLKKGNSGEFSWKMGSTRESHEEINLEFVPLKCQNCSDELMKRFLIDYSIIISEELKVLNLRGKCGILSYDSEHRNRTETEPFFREIKVRENKSLSFQDKISYELNLPFDKKFHVNIKAQVLDLTNDINENFTGYSLFYSPLQIVTEPERSFRVNKSLYLGLLVIATAMLVICFLTCFHYYRKYSYIKKNIRYQVQDVSHLGNIESVVNVSVELQRRNYQGFQDEGN